MKIAINLAAAAPVLLAAGPAFAHGSEMGHMSGNMGGSMGMKMNGSMGMANHQTVIRTHEGVHSNWHFPKTTKATGKSHTARHLKTFKFRNVVRIEREIRRLRFELFKLKLEGRGNSFEAHRLLFRVVELGKLING